MEIQTFFYATRTIFIASFVQGMTGFGFIVISIPLLSLLTSIKFAVPLLALCGFIISGYLFYRLRRDFSFSGIKRLLVEGVLAIPIGAFFLRNASSGLAKDILGVIISHLSLGLKTVSIVTTVFKISPFLIEGSVLGHCLFGYTPIHTFRKIILMLLIFIPLSLILSS